MAVGSPVRMSYLLTGRIFQISMKTCKVNESRLSVLRICPLKSLHWPLSSQTRALSSLKGNFNEWYKWFLNVHVSVTTVRWMLWSSRFQGEREDQGREQTVPSMIVPLPQSQIWRSFFAISVLKDTERLAAYRLEISLSYVSDNQCQCQSGPCLDKTQRGEESAACPTDWNISLILLRCYIFIIWQMRY